MMRRSQVVSPWLLLLCLIAGDVQGDWPRFRGPNGSGVAQETAATPVRWDESANLKWKVPLPGPGSSSPIVVGERVFVTCWSGYGIDRDHPGDQSELRRHLVCLNRHDGQVIWDRVVEPILPEDDYGGMFAEHGYASHTPVSDGEHVYVYFGKSGALAFDLEGNQLWQSIIGAELDPHGWGSASSPILYQDLLIVTASAESEALVGLDKRTGKEVWRQEASGLNGLWGTPVLVEVDAHRNDLVVAVPYEIWGLNPSTGKLRWYCTGLESNTSCSSVIAGDGAIVFAIEGRGGGSIAVQAGGNGDVTDSHVVWTGRSTNRIATPVLYEGRLYFFNGGVANCVDAKSGETIFQDRLLGAQRADRGGAGRRDGGPGRGFGGDYSSPVVADGKVYFVARNGDMYVLAAGDEFVQLAVNRVTDQPEDFSGTPAVSNGELFIRSDKHLYCVAPLGQTPKPQQVTRESADDAREPLATDNQEQPGRVRDGEPRRFGGGAGGPGGPGGPGGGRRFDPDAIFRERDTNADGKLSGDEVSTRLRGNLEQIDTNKDGAVSADEFRQGLQRMFAGGGGRGGYSRRGREQRPKRPVMEE
jgi:outer membrane protein assembly factor BamB